MEMGPIESQEPLEGRGPFSTVVERKCDWKNGQKGNMRQALRVEESVTIEECGGL